MDIKKYLLDFYIEKNGEKISPELAHELVEGFPVTDGTDRQTGEKWTISETTDVGNKMGIDWNSISQAEWYLMLNSMYSDYYSVGRKHGLTDYNFFAEMTQAWFEDSDAKKNKTFKYFFC